MFRTELPLTPHPQQLPLSARVLTIGSCFSDSIGSRLVDFKVATMVNPFGTVFNPLSACKLLRAAAGEDMDWQQHLVEARGRWQSYDLHAEVGADNPVALLQHIQTLTREAGVFLATADAVVLTLGTAYAYRLRETDEIISNCHKVPAEKFEREMLTADEIIAAVAETHAYLRRINPKLRFVLTVSPVRHLTETLVLNSASKSMLRVACHYLSELLPDVSYFPAYELLLDDLRDYRFYASDMLHPSEVAENYIWERFTRTYFDTAFGRFKKEWEGIRQALGHRPLHAAAPEHRQFLEATLERLRKISSQADVRMEMLHVERELAALPIPVLEPEAPELEELDDDEERIDIGSVAPGEEVETKESAASLVRPGAGLLVEPEEAAEEAEDEADITPESAYEHAYTLAQTEESDDEATEAADTDSEENPDEPVRKKKRRSRGGAKRTKRKHARLAAENNTGAAVTSTSVEEAAEPTSFMAPEEQQEEPVTEPDSEVVYITEAELRRGNRRTSEPEPEVGQPVPETAEPQDAPGTPNPEPEITSEARPRRSRNKRREPRPEPADRPAGRTSRRPLYAAPEEPAATVSVPEEASEAPQPAAPEPAVAPVAETTATPDPEVVPSDAEFSETSATAPSEPVAAQDEAAGVAKPAGRNRRSAAPTSSARPSRSKKPQGTTAAEAVAPEPTAPTQPTPADTPPVAASPAAPVAAAAPKARSRKRPAAPETSLPPAEAPTPPAPAETSAATPKKRAPRRPAPATVEAPPVPSAPTSPEVAPEAAPAPPKRRARPPRRKPDPDASVPENT